MFRFHHPLAFGLLLPLAVAAWRLCRRRPGTALLFTGLATLPAPPMTWRLRLMAALPACYLLGAALAIVALARPQQAHSRITRTTDAVAIQMAIDTSGSMEALDFSHDTTLRTRLDVVKQVFADFIRQRPDDLIGLIAFAGYPATRAPLTLDHDALLRILETVEVPQTRIGPDGQIANPEEMLTAIGDALAAACARLEAAAVKSRIIVLLSDGESNFGAIKPMEAARAAQTLGIRVYAIGVGSSGLAPVRARDAQGRVVMARARVTLDETLLKRIAETTGGVYYNVRDPQALKQALAAIDQLEKTRVASATFTTADEWFAYFLTPGLLLIALAVSVKAGLGRDLA